MSLPGYIGDFSFLGIFALRALGFAVTAILIIATICLADRLTDDDAFNDRRIYNRRFAGAIICGFLAAAAIATVVAELIVGNPNHWLGMKLAFYVTIWLFVAGGTFELEVCNDAVSGKLYVLTGIAAVICVSCLISAACRPAESIHIDDEIVSTTELVAASDAYQISGSGGGSFLYHSMVISTNGVYRYYYRHENGAIQQGSVNVENTYIYYTEPGEAPHLERHRSYNVYLRFVNCQTIREISAGATWYDLYIPEGSILTDFSFDLN